MVAEQIAGRGVGCGRVLAAVSKVPRHRFVPEALRRHSYEDRPLPIGEGQTISQPYIVAYMTELLDLGEDDRVLEIGTGSGYQTAVLAALAGRVYTVENHPCLARRARATLDDLGVAGVRYHLGDGYEGWSEHAPFDAILVTCAPCTIPGPLVDQLAPGGVLLLPLGGDRQVLTRVRKLPDGRVHTEALVPVRFVPLTTGLH